jgi:chemotaxis protein CheC
MSIQPYTEDQRDALQEVVNIAMGQAGDALARILTSFIRLSVPRIRLVTAADVAETVSGMLEQNAEITAVRQAFANGLQGEAIVLFTQSDVHDLAKLMDYDEDINEAAEQELLMEISNLLVGAIISGISDTLNIELTFSPPSLMADHAPLSKVLNGATLPWTHALLMEVNFTVEHHAVRCHLFLFMMEKAVNTLRGILDEFLEDN